MSIDFTMPEAEYHARPELSSTEAGRILESPATYKWFREHPQKHRDAFDLGSAVHAQVLGTGWGVVELFWDDWRSKEAQRQRDEVRAAGKIPMLSKDLVQVRAMTEAVLTHPTARKLLEGGHPEVSVFSKDPETGVDMRARFDYLPDQTDKQRIAVDLKTTSAKANAEGFARSVAAYGYHIQSAHYLETLGDDTEMAFVVVETAAPYLVGVHRLSDHFNEIGAADARRAREIYAECVATGEWPGYPLDVQTIDPPSWLAWKHEEAEAEIEIA